jgi:UDPglucose--hexose-1-phosphate uridylyltransferase
MAQLRRDYLLNRYVIIAEERGKRPHQFSSQKQPKEVKLDFFAPGNENLTPEEIGRREDQNGWYIRWFDNKFPAVQKEGNYNIRTDNIFYTFADAVGKHEVIVESPKIEDELADLSVKHIKEILEVYRERINELSKLDAVKYVQVFKNHLSQAGTSIVHTHSQVIAYNLIPTIIDEKSRAVKEYFSKYGHSPYDDIIAREIDSLRRIIENDHFISFTPYASRFPMEAWIFPKRCAYNLNDFSDEELFALADQLKYILMKLQTINAPYNILLYYAPKDEFRFHIEICPRLTTWAGFELATGTIINPVSPEEAAKFYRS